MLKLDKECKAMRKEMLAALPEGSTLAMSHTGFTVLIVAGESVNYLATAVASWEDQSDGISRKVGEFYALNRWQQGECVPVPTYMNSADEFLCTLHHVVKPLRDGSFERIISD